MLPSCSKRLLLCVYAILFTFDSDANRLSHGVPPRFGPSLLYETTERPLVGLLVGVNVERSRWAGAMRNDRLSFADGSYPFLLCRSSGVQSECHLRGSERSASVSNRAD